jgi:2-succinyl-6-hydroxy-2,4-cyclohexadiene-1-carboxylate synthase
MEPDLVVGYSMGGRLALWLCAQVPSLETTVVAISANPGILDPTSRAARRDRDEQLAARLEHLQPARGIDTDDTEVRGFLRAWDAQPLFAARRLGEAELRDRAAGDPRGWAWALRTYGTGAQPDLVPALAASRARLHLVVGGADSAYRAHAERLHGRARRVVIPGAGHDVPAEAPDLLAGAILGLLAN